MNKMKKFEVYTLDTFPDDEDGGWVENERQKIGTIEVQSGEQALPVVILDAIPLEDDFASYLVGGEAQ